MENIKFKHKCPVHPDEKVIFLKIVNLGQDSNQRLFYCSSCVMSNASFKQDEFQSIKNILKCQSNEILQNWPPINDPQLLQNLSQINFKEESIQLQIDQIISFFENFKREINLEIDSCQKNMIKIAEEIPIKSQNIINKYNELSRINELKHILLDNQTNIQEKEQIYKSFNETVSSQKANIIRELKQQLNQISNSYTIFDPVIPLQTKQNIINQIRNINLFSIFQNDRDRFDCELMKANTLEIKNEGLSLNKQQDNSYEIITLLNLFGWSKCVSKILEINNKYIFRLKVNNNQDWNYFVVGLSRDKQCFQNDGTPDQFYTTLTKQNNEMIQSSGYFKDQYQRVPQFNQDQIIELRICLDDLTFDILDYPQYQSKYSLLQNRRAQLVNYENLRLFLSIRGQISMKLIETLIVEEFY